MSRRFEELDRRSTSMGEISVRRRLEPSLGIDVYEVKLGDEHLMSSLFTVAETALAELALAAVDGTPLDVVVGGLGLGYTARAALGDARVRSLHVVDAIDAVVEWHERELLPNSRELTADDRCHLVTGDFFHMVASGAQLGPEAPDRVDAVLLDIDHTPRHHLHPSHADFYTVPGLGRLCDRLRPGGVFALWSDDPPDDEFVATAEEVFSVCEPHVVTFPNHHTGGEASNTVYVASM